VSRESFRLQRTLTERGYRITRYSAAAFKVDVVESDGTIRGLDVFGGFLSGGRLHLMGEIRTRFEREWVTPLGTATLEGHEFPVPADTDRFLAATYGKSWRVPDPAFHFTTPQSTHRRFNGWFRGTRMKRALWDRLYARRPRPQQEPSDLARWAADREPGLTQVVDLGCGTGGDVLWFARNGVHATGLDFVLKGFERAKEQAAEEDLDATFLLCNLLELRSFFGTAALVGAEHGPRVVLARHLIDGVGPLARRRAFQMARVLLQDGGRLYLQFVVRVGDDGYAGSVRARRRAPKVVGRELRRLGATIVEREFTPVPNSGATGGRPTKICRMVATWEQ
jgi:SAM-dependent methyltransferase